MLVINGDRDRIPSTEKTVLDWLRTWNGAYLIGGVAISHCYIRDRRRGRERDAVEADLVVITPHTCLVIEVKGLTEPLGGVLSCPANGPWSLPGIHGNPVHVRRNDTNPLDQVREGVFNLKNLTERAGVDAFVSGLVLVMPYPGFEVTLAKKDLPKGINVLVGSLNDLRVWFHGTARRKGSWTAEQAHAVLSALNFGHAVTVADLAAQGFSSRQPTAPTQSTPAEASSTASLRAWLAGVEVSTGSAIVGPPRRKAFRPIAQRMPPAPPAWAAAVARARQRSAQDRERFADDFNSRYPVPAPVSPPPFPDPTPRRRRPNLQTLAALVLIVLVFGGFWLFVQARTGTDPQDTGTPDITQTTRAEPPSPPSQTPPAQEAESPTELRPCFPFQVDC